MRIQNCQSSKQIILLKIVFFGIVFVITILFVAVYRINKLKPIEPNEPKAIDLLTGQNWQEFAGATTTKEGLLIQPLNRIIIHQDGSLGQPNPPVSLTGPRLSVFGDFMISARMEKIDVQGSLRLYGKPPVIYDQWRLENGSIAIDVATSTIVVRIWDGSSNNSIDMRTYPFDLKNVTAISIEHRGNKLIFSADKQVLGTMPDHNIFNSQEVWFGADAAVGDDWLLNALTVTPLNNGHVEIIAPPSFKTTNNNPNTLGSLAAAHPRKLRIGAAIAFGPLVTDEDYRKIAMSEFSMITPENGMKPEFIHPRPDVYVFTEIDTLVDISLKNNLLVHGHALVYAKSNPDWISNAPKNEHKKIMIDHITAVVDHFKGRVAEWDVVNEPLSDKKAPYHNKQSGLEKNIWYEAMGEEYIDLAFRSARQADPSAKLYLNDYGLERDGERWDALLGLIKRLKERGVPIDGIGFESHVYGDGDYNDPDVLKAHLRTLAAFGLKARISEIDVTGDDPKEQVNQFLIALDACLRSDNCTGYSTWGITDLYGSTTRSDRYPAVYGTSLLFDTELKAKPAYSALQQRLRQPY